MRTGSADPGGGHWLACYQFPSRVTTMMSMTASKHGKHRLTRRERLLVYDRTRELERRADESVTSKMLRMEAAPDFDAAVSRLPYRPAPARPAVVAETRRAVQEACEQAQSAAAARRSDLAAIAAGLMPGSPAWARWKQRT